MTRLAFLVNKDKTVNLFSITGDIRPVSAVCLKWHDKTPVISLATSLPWAMDEMADVLRAVSNIIHELDDQAPGTSGKPLAVIDAILEAKGSQVVVDGRGKVRNVTTSKDGMITYKAKGLDLEIEIEPDDTKVRVEEGEQVDGPETREEQDERARKQLKKLVMAKMMNDDTSMEDVEDLTLWVKAGAKVEILEDGKRPVALDPKVVFGK